MISEVMKRENSGKKISSIPSYLSGDLGWKAVTSKAGNLNPKLPHDLYKADILT